MSSLDELSSRAMEDDLQICAIQEKEEGFKSGIINHIVFLVHGIHDHAEWQESLSRAVEQAPHIRGVPIKYGYFDVLRFLISRLTPIKKFETEFQVAAGDRRIDHISIVAHSFGSYVISKVLQRNRSDISTKLHRIILCGSIIDDNYHWQSVLPCHEQDDSVRIINDCGIRDYWPMWAKFTGLGFGATGRVGFGCYSVLDRFHNIGHGDFFKENFIGEYWIPFLTEGKVKEGMREVPRPSKLFSLIATSYFRLTTITAILFVILLIWVFTKSCG